MSFDDDEKSVQANRPIDLFTITTPTATYLHTSHPVDVTYAGNVYTALTTSRGNLTLKQDPTGNELIVYLPITHPLVQRFAATGIPEHSVQVSLQRLQTRSGVVQPQMSGFAGGISLQDHVALVRVPSLTDDAVKIQLPVVGAQKLCNHVLFDGQCSPNPGVDGPAELFFSWVTTLVSQTVAPGSATLVIASNNGEPDGWFTFGEIVHQPTLQHRSILQHIGTTLVINGEFVGASPGDSIGLTAGCAHDVLTCKNKFSNVLNFGGHPGLNAFNPWYLHGLGVVEQA